MRMRDVRSVILCFVLVSAGRPGTCCGTTLKVLEQLQLQAFGGTHGQPKARPAHEM